MAARHAAAAALESRCPWSHNYGGWLDLDLEQRLIKSDLVCLPSYAFWQECVGLLGRRAKDSPRRRMVFLTVSLSTCARPVPAAPPLLIGDHPSLLVLSLSALFFSERRLHFSSLWGHPF